MNFFQNLTELMNEDADLNLKISKTEEGLIVRLHHILNSSQAKTNLPELIIRGTGSELDAHFFDTIRKPMEKSTGIVANIEWHEKAMATIEKKNKEELDKKMSTKPKANAKFTPIAPSSISPANTQPVEAQKPQTESKTQVNSTQIKGTKQHQNSLF